MTLWTGDLNYLAVVVAALIPMALGMWWYARDSVWATSGCG